MLSEQDKSEIRKSYRNAIDPRQQVKILSQLYLVSREEILDILGPLFKSARPKPSRKGQPRRIYAPELKAEAMERLRSGESFGGWLRIWASMCGPWLHGPIMYEGRKKTDAKL